MINGYENGKMYVGGEAFNQSVATLEALIPDLGTYRSIDFDTGAAQKNQYRFGYLVPPIELSGLSDVFAQVVAGQEYLAEVARKAVNNPPDLPKLIASECARRLEATATDSQMKWLLLTAQTGALSGTQSAALNAFSGWTSQMRSKRDTLIADANTNYADDDQWPDVPSDVTDLIANY